MNKPFVTVNSIYKRFGGEFINHCQTNKDNKIYSPKLNRASFELNGIFFHQKLNSIIYWGNMESQFLFQLSEEKKIKHLEAIFQANPPLIILTKNFFHQDLLNKVNQKLNTQIPIINTNLSSVEITTTIAPWLAKKLATWTTIHGVLVSVFGEGILIKGSAGIGKTELAVELVHKNHMFVGDDAIDVSVVGNTLIGKANELVYGFIEVRGLGILDIKRMYGMQSLLNSCTINLIIELKSDQEVINEKIEIERLGSNLSTTKLLGINIPHYIIPVSYGRKISEVIESAVIDFKLKQYEKYIACDAFNARINSAITKKDE